MADHRVLIHIFLNFFIGFTLILGDSQITTSLEKLLSGYDKRVRPLFGYDTDVILANAIVHDIELHERSKTVSLSVTLTETWNDQRLEYSDSFDEIVIKELYHRLWMPDTMFHAAKEFENTAGYSVRLRTTGNVSATRRIVVTAKYQTYSGTFPLDSNVCKLRIRSESYPVDQLLLNWTSDAVRWDPEITIPGFTLGKKEISQDIVETLNGEKYSELHFSFIMKHQNSAFLLCLLGPLVLVTMSFASFWITENALLGRYCYLVVVSIMLCTHAVVVFNRSADARLSTATSLDIWEGACFLFLLVTMLETLVISHLLGKSRQMTENTANKKKEGIPETPTTTANDSYLCAAHRIDTISRIALPAAFIVFSSVFWVTRLYQ